MYDRTILIQNVPARVCRGCKEEFYDETILSKLEHVRGEQPPVSLARRVIGVPVYVWEDL